MVASKCLVSLLGVFYLFIENSDDLSLVMVRWPESKEIFLLLFDIFRANTPAHRFKLYDEVEVSF